VAKPDDKYKCGVFCFDSNNLLAITYKTVTNIEVRIYMDEMSGRKQT
jgi:hypothetical protein